MFYSPLLLLILIFTGVLLFIMVISSYLANRRERRSLVGKISQDSNVELLEKTTVSDEEEKQNLRETIQYYFTQSMSWLGNLVKPKKEGEISNLQKTFLHAGVRNRNAVIIFFGAKVFCAILLSTMFCCFQFFVLKSLGSLRFMITLVVFAIISFYLPDMWLRMKIASRKEKIRNGFPDTLDLLVVCVEAGVGMDAAINRVASEMRNSYPEICEEFQILNRELMAGKTRQDALKNLAVRIELDDVRSLVTLLIQTDRFGTSVAQALRVYSDAMRSKRAQRAEEQAAKLPVKLLFPLIFFIFPTLFVAILGPAAIRMVRMMYGG